MIRRILCPTDFSDASAAAWKLALNFARLFEAEIVVLHVLSASPPLEDLHEMELARDLFKGGLLRDPPRLEEVYELEGAAESVRLSSPEAIRQRLGDLVAQATKWKVPATSKVRQGVEFQEINQVAREEGANLIVMGTHGRTGLAHLLFGSVADQVVRTAPCPVLTVRDLAMTWTLFDGNDRCRGGYVRQNAIGPIRTVGKNPGPIHD